MTLQPQKRALQNGFVFSFRSSQQKWQGRTAPAKVKPSNKHDSCCGVNPLIDTSAASENGPARTSLSPRSEDHFKTARELDVIGLFPHGFNMVSRIFLDLAGRTLLIPLSYLRQSCQGTNGYLQKEHSGMRKKQLSVTASPL